jgi:hypothetical protein
MQVKNLLFSMEAKLAARVFPKIHARAHCDRQNLRVTVRFVSQAI